MPDADLVSAPKPQISFACAKCSDMFFWLFDLIAVASLGESHRQAF